MQRAERDRRIAKAFRGGTSAREIAKMAGITVGRVYAILNNMGVSPRQEGNAARPVTWNEKV